MHNLKMNPLNRTSPSSWRSRWPFYLFIASIVVVIFTFFSIDSSHAASYTRPKSWFSNSKSDQAACQHGGTHGRPNLLPTSSSSNPSDWKFDHRRDSLNYGLSDEQCEESFPRLYQEIERARGHWAGRKITREDVSYQGLGTQIRTLIYDGQLYVLGTHRGGCDKTRSLAVLGNINRAISGIPEPAKLPNVEFIINVEDKMSDTGGNPDGKPVWTWCRIANDNVTWIMPDFDGWSYPNPAVGGYPSFRRRLQQIEKPFEQKKPQAVWRGPVGAHPIRRALMEVSENRDWADVKELDWGSKTNVMKMHEFCYYQFPIHTEGNSWSGRLRYLHNCDSATVVHDLQYFAHYYALFVPDGPDQNMISTKADFSDLPAKMDHFLTHPEDAKRIAQNSVATFRDRYLTPAAEACYWRRMIRAWAEVQDFEPELFVAEDQDMEESAAAGAGADVDSAYSAAVGRKTKERGHSFELYASQIGLGLFDEDS